MKNKVLLSIAGLICLVFTVAVFFKQGQNSLVKTNIEASEVKTSGAGQSLDAWSFERAYPNSFVPTSKYLDAFSENKIISESRESVIGEWESLGPINIGGRTLCLAFHPTDENIMFAGSASGGLWKTTTQGLGQNAWEYVPTGFPVLGVAAIAIDQNDPNTILIGTGETYGVGFAEPGTTVRLTRGTYGIGILKTIDGGAGWSHVLVFDENEIKGVQDIVINPQNSQIMFAATTDGVYRSTNGGDDWSLVFNEINCIDIEIDPSNGNTIYVSQGNFNNALDPNLCGIFKSIDGGNSFNELLDPGLISAWSGNAKLEIDPANTNTIYASIQVGWFNTDPTTPAGLYKSSNGGVNWAKINDQNIAQYQGWYSHDIAVNPTNQNEMMYVGISGWKSTDTGLNFLAKTANSWTMGQVPVDVPEGLPNYVHSDIHAVYYHPLNNKVYMASDGGVFVSDDGEIPYTTLNGGLQTTQFYADMASSAQDPNYCMGGAQDNASYIYKGEPSWWRVIGGDGMSASVHQDDNSIVFGSWQGLNIVKSINGGDSFFNIGPNLEPNDYTAFSAPYELSPSNQDVMYAGGTYLYKSVDIGATWTPTGGQSVDGSNVIMKIAISPFNENIVYVATVGDPFGTWGGPPKILKSINGGQSFTVLNGLPNRVCKDIEIDPNDHNVVYAVFSGFGSDHVFKSINGGSNWSAIDGILPDVPTNTIAIDPLNSEDIYVGNDLGVYYSEDGGVTWEPFADALPEATMVYDLNVSPANRKLRIATHGHGIWERSFVNDPLAVTEFDLASTIKLYPNPASELTYLDFILENNIRNVVVDVFTIQGQKLSSLYEGQLHEGQHKITFNVSQYKSGLYFIKLKGDNVEVIKRLLVR
jgi:hypothetical protein